MKIHTTSRASFFSKLCTLAIASGACLLGSATHAALLVYDGFGVGPDGHTDGASIIGLGNGIGWTGNWELVSGDPALSITQDRSIAPTGLQSESGVLYRDEPVNTARNYVGRHYSTTFGGAEPSIPEAWFSFSMNRPGERFTAINIFDTQINAGAGQFFGLYADNNSDEMFARIRFGGSADVVMSANSFNLDTSTHYFIIGQVQFNETLTADVLNVWFQTEATFGDPLGPPDLTVAYDFDQSFSYWTIDMGNPSGSNDLTLDEFRIGTTAESVMPILEPATGTLIIISSIGGWFTLGLGVMSFIFHRVRMRQRSKSSVADIL